MNKADDIICHAPGDRCHGCDHYHGKAPECKYKGERTIDERASDEYHSILLTYIRELNKAHKGIRRLVRRNRKLEDRLKHAIDFDASLQQEIDIKTHRIDCLVNEKDELRNAIGRLRVGQYEISPFNNNYWIGIVEGDACGEGMQVKEADFVELIDRYYKENF